MELWVEGEGDVTILFIPCIILNTAHYNVIFRCNLCIKEAIQRGEIFVVRLEIPMYLFGNGIVLV